MDYFEQIKSYLDKKMPDAERQTFETELAKNAELRRSVEEYRLLFGLLKNRKQPDMSNVDAAEHQRLRSVVLAAFDDVDTEGSQIVSFPFQVLKKNSVWWAAAASIVVVFAAGLWWFLNSKKRVQTVAQTPIDIVDTFKKIDAPTIEKPLVIQTPKTPQYKPSEKPKVEIIEKQNMPKQRETNEVAEVKLSDTEVFAEVKTVLDAEKIESLSRSGNRIEAEIEAEFKAVINLLLQKNTNEALTKLGNLNGTRAQFYRAITYLMIDRTKGKSALEELVKETTYSDKSLHKKAKGLLEKLK